MGFVGQVRLRQLGRQLARMTTGFVGSDVVSIERYSQESQDYVGQAGRRCIDDRYPVNQSPKSSGRTDNQGTDQLNKTRLEVPLNLGTKQPTVVCFGISIGRG
jgi:hypothetical protein